MSSEHVTIPGDPMIGRQIGNYRVASKLGQGGMGAVYKLEHIKLPNTFKAMKVMLTPGAETALLRFEQEAMVAASVGTDRVVKVDDYGTLPDGTAYFIMEFVEGSDLGDYLEKNGALSLEAALKLCFRIADTLAVAHSKGITHRDLKPPNILLPRRSFDPKVADWGVSRASAEVKLVQTVERVIIGTPGYMSPEMALGLPHDARTDIFSLGVILFQLLTGKLPYPPTLPSATLELLNEFLARPAPTIASARPEHLERAPDVIEELVARAIAKDVKYRFATMIEFRDEIRRCAEWLSANSGGVVRNPMATMISEHADSSGRMPSMRATPGQVEAIIQRYATPTPKPTADGYARPVTGGTQAPAPSFVQQTPSRNTPVLALLIALLAGAIGVGAWLIMKPKPAPRVADDAPLGRFLVSTNPVGATVIVEGRAIGTSPVIVTGKPGETRRVHLSLAGYDDQDETIEFATEDRKGEFVLSRHPEEAKPPTAGVEPTTAERASTHPQSGGKPAKAAEHSSKRKPKSPDKPKEDMANPWQ
jgi:serine/threonine-protein kinase